MGTGGTAGLVSTMMLGPRRGRFTGTKSNVMPMSSPTLAVLGLFILWWGWYGFNAGSTLQLSDNGDLLAGKVGVNTSIASGIAGLGGVVFSWLMHRRKYVDVLETVACLLGGLVSITAPCAWVSEWESAIIGLVGCWLVLATPKLLDRFLIDDPVGVIPVHLVCGMWGLFAAGLFNRPNVYDPNGADEVTGLFWGGGFEPLGVQCMGIVAIATWTSIITFVILKFIDRVHGLRVDEMAEIMGLDRFEHRVLDVELLSDPTLFAGGTGPNTGTPTGTNAMLGDVSIDETGQPASHTMALSRIDLKSAGAASVQSPESSRQPRSSQFTLMAREQGAVKLPSTIDLVDFVNGKVGSENGGSNPAIASKIGQVAPAPPQDPGTYGLASESFSNTNLTNTVTVEVPEPAADQEAEPSRTGSPSQSKFGALPPIDKK